jgi:hypothetical protein
MQQFGGLLLAARKDGGNTLIFARSGKNATNPPSPCFYATNMLSLYHKKEGLICPS